MLSSHLTLSPLSGRSLSTNTSVENLAGSALGGSSEDNQYPMEVCAYYELLKQERQKSLVMQAENEQLCEKARRLSREQLILQASGSNTVLR
tara:strand:- start:774 stop:1049 length:276 start_codon:yes stop_codon:yes gene_type:complete